ncbi:hypothetical protein B0H14DRAFT_3776049 [Mycena olivaceomarginata]|nr:hypothetical protein B0H14DRAFT_3776049 [Mycena olivaceomarginata]
MICNKVGERSSNQADQQTTNNRGTSFRARWSRGRHPPQFTTPDPRIGQSIRFDIPNLRRDATAPAKCDVNDPNKSITPACLQAWYNIPITPATQQNNPLLVTGYVQQWRNDEKGATRLSSRTSKKINQQCDSPPRGITQWAPRRAKHHTAFMKQFRPDLPSSANQTFLRLSIDGGTNPQFPNSAGIEAQLDIEYTAGIASEVPLQFLTVSGLDFPTALLDTPTFLASSPQPPTVRTTSYGDLESNFGPSLATSTGKFATGMLRQAHALSLSCLPSGDWDLCFEFQRFNAVGLCSQLPYRVQLLFQFKFNFARSLARVIIVKFNSSSTMVLTLEVLS